MAPRPPRRPRRIAYLGSPALAVTPLRTLVEAGYEIPLVVTRADKRRRRRRPPEPTPVKAAALELGLEVTDDIDRILDVPVDLGVVVAYGRLIGADVFTTVPLVNIHFSLLPRWRGAAPVERAILAGDTTTGVCLMTIAEELDAGDLYGCRELPVHPDDTVDSLRDRLVTSGTELLMDRLANGFPEPRPQSGTPSHAAKITSEERRLDWTRTATELDRVIRVGGAWTTLDGARLKILEAEPVEADGELDPGEVAGTDVGTGAGAMRLRVVQPEAKPPRPAEEWRRGARLDPGSRLGT